VAGVADAGIASSEYVPLGEKEGVTMLLHGRDILPDYVRTCIMTSGKTLATRRDDTIHFMAAEMNAVAYAIAHRDATLKLAAQLTDTKPDDPRAAYLFDDALRTKGIDPELGLPVDKFEWLEQLLIKQGDVQHSFDINKLVDSDIRVKALALAGP
jgi:NitT/TauT family transport system substrate-binding protein